MSDGRLCLHDGAAQVGGAFDDVGAGEVGDEGGLDDGAVVIGDIGIGEDVGDWESFVGPQAGKGGCEEEEGDAACAEESDDACVDAEWWIVYDDGAGGIVGVLVVAAGIEWAENCGASGLGRPASEYEVEDGVVDGGRCVAIVCGFLCFAFEFLDEFLVVFSFCHGVLI